VSSARQSWSCDQLRPFRAVAQTYK